MGHRKDQVAQKVSFSAFLIGPHQSHAVEGNFCPGLSYLPSAQVNCQEFPEAEPEFVCPGSVTHESDQSDYHSHLTSRWAF